MQTIDVLIIGGGINGVACAREIAANNKSACLLIEQYDKLAEGTSSRSSKLIHGGLRYLESLQFSLVKESLAEQRQLLKHYPDLVKTVPFYIPVYQNSRRRPWQIRLGLMLYQWLGSRGFQSIAREHWKKLDGLDTDGLQAVFCYQDAQTDDRALTNAVMQAAIKDGAGLWLKTHLIQAEWKNDHWQVQLNKAGQTVTINCQKIINAAGPWVNQVLDRIKTPSTTQKLTVDWIAGTHIIIPSTEENATRQGIYYLEAPQDQRAVFVMPWQGDLMIGTTERNYHGKPEDIAPTDEEIQYLLQVYNHYFPAKIKHHQIKHAFAGLRVLPRTDSSLFFRSREAILHTKNAHMVTIYGGKLTTHAATARQVYTLMLAN